MDNGTEAGGTIGLNARMSRRGALRLMGGVGAAAAMATMLPKAAGATSGPGYFITTSALNLRKTASSSGQILLVIPFNKKVKNLGASSNGYSKVTYNGTTGWAYSAYLKADVPAVDANWIGNAKTTSSVNFRNGPSTGDGVLAVIAKGKTVKISDRVENGFRYVEANGALGWIYDDLLADVDAPAGPLRFKTTTSVNLRANPSSSASVIKVVPKGTIVFDYDLVMSNGYRGVDVGDTGTRGWIADNYLQQI